MSKVPVHHHARPTRVLAAGPKRDPASAPPSAPRYSQAQDIVELVVLTADQSFLKMLRASAGAAHRLWHVQSADRVGDLLTAGEVGILLLDVDTLEATGDAAERFIGDLKRQFTELVIVAAGQPRAQPPLAKLIGTGTVHRFLPKPVSAERARQGIDAAVGRHVQLRKPRPAPRTSRRGGRRRVLLVGAAAVLCMTAAARWEWGRAAPQAAAARPREAARPPSPSPAPPAAGDHEQWLERAEDALLTERLDEAATAIDAARRTGAEPGRIALLNAQLAAARARRTAHAATAGA